MEWLVSILSSSGLGSIIGLAGGLITKRLELKSLATEMKFKLEQRKLDLQESAQERGHEIDMANKNIERAQVEGQIQVESLEVGAFTESQKNGKVDGALRFVRPVITGYLLIMSSVLFYSVWSNVGGLTAIPKAELVEMLLMMISTAMFLTVTCTAWWFGSRGGNIGKQK